VGPVAERLASIAPVLAQEGILLTEQRRLWDRVFWPHAKKGFFQFKAIIPSVLGDVMP
jgi:deoxyribodipyrimidine photo-lyase